MKSLMILLFVTQFYKLFGLIVQLKEKTLKLVDESVIAFERQALAPTDICVASEYIPLAF